MKYNTLIFFLHYFSKFFSINNFNLLDNCQYHNKDIESSGKLIIFKYYISIIER